MALVKVLLLRNQYHRFDNGKSIQIDSKNKEIVLSDLSANKTIITPNDIKEVEQYTSWNTLPIFSQLGYTKFFLKKGEAFILTNFTVSENYLSFLNTGKSVKRIKRLMNKIR